MAVRKYGMDLKKEIAHVLLAKRGGEVRSEELDEFLEEVEECYDNRIQFDYADSMKRLRELGPYKWLFDEFLQRKDGGSVSWTQPHEPEPCHGTVGERQDGTTLWRTDKGGWCLPMPRHPQPQTVPAPRWA